MNMNYWRQHEPILLAFESAWRNECPPILNQYLEGAEVDDQKILLAELVMIDFEHRWRRKELANVDRYLSEYTVLNEDRDVRNELLRHEFLLRKSAGIIPSEDELNLRFQGDSSVTGLIKEIRLDHDAFLPTDTLVGTYKIEQLIGQGAFASVYSATDVDLRRPVALKLLDTQHVQPASKLRLRREAQTVAALEHPNIVPIYDSGNHRGRDYIASKLIDGVTLNHWLRDNSKSFHRIAELTAQLGFALEHAHHAGVVHRDIKPANIMVEANKPILLDFGLAHFSESSLQLTHDGDLLGTPAYMSPEQARGDGKVGPASDIYSLGIILYELICGQLPFQGNASSVLQQTIFRDPTPPRSIDPSIPLDLATICMKAISKEPSARYHTAGQMAEDLQRFTNHQPILARPLGIVGKTVKFFRRQQMLTATLLTSLVLIASILVISFLNISAQRDRAVAGMHESLINQAETSLRSKQPGWHQQTLDTIQQASALRFPGRDITRQRELMIETLLDTTARLETTASCFISSGNPGVLSVAPRERFIAVATETGTVELRSFDLTQRLATLASHEDGQSRWSHLDFSSDGETLFGIQNGRLWRWNLDFSDSATGTSNHQGSKTPFDNVNVFAISNHRIAISQPTHGIRIFQIEDGKIGKQLSSIPSGSSSILDMDFSSDGQTLATSTRLEIRKWAVGTGKPIARKQLWRPAQCLCLRSIDELIWTDRVSSVADFWLNSFDDKSQSFSSQTVDVATTDQFFVTATKAGELALFTMGNLSVEKLTHVQGLGEIVSIATDKNRKEIFVGYRSGEIRRWELASNELVKSNRGFVHALEANEQGYFFGSDVFHPKLDKNGRPNTVPGCNVADFALGKHPGLIVCCQDADVVVLNNNIEERRFPSVHSSKIEQVSLSPDETLVAARSSRSLKILSLADGSVVKEIDLPREDITNICMTDQHCIVVDGRGIKAISIWSEKHPSNVIQTQKGVASGLAVNRSYVAVPYENRINIFNTETWQLERVLVGHEAPIIQIEAMTNSNQWISLSQDRTLRVWNADGSEDHQIDVPENTTQFSYDPQGQFVLLRFHVGKPDQLHDFETGKLLIRMTHFPSNQNRFEFSPNGEQVYFCGGSFLAYSRATIKANIHRGELSREYQVILPGASLYQTWAVSVSPDDRWYISGGYEKFVLVRDQQTYQIRHVLTDFGDDVWSADFSPDSRILLVGSRRDGYGEISSWDTNDWSLIKRTRFGTRLVSEIDHHPTLPVFVASNFDGEVSLFNADSHEVIQNLLPPSSATMHVEFSDDGKYVAAARTSKGIRVWPLTNTGSLKVGEPIDVLTPNEMIWCASFTPDSDELVSASESGKIRIYSFPAMEQRVMLQTGMRSLRKVQYLPDKDILAVSAFFGFFRGQFFDLKRLRELLRNHNMDW